jgi:hypothetical protein
MRRHVRPLHFARLRVIDLTNYVTWAPQPKWPRHLQLACEILEEKYRVPAREARSIIGASVGHALACAQAIDRRALILGRCRNRIKIRKSFSRLAKCVARAPASLRNDLDNKIYEIVPETPIRK